MSLPVDLYSTVQCAEFECVYNVYFVGQSADPARFVTATDSDA